MNNKVLVWVLFIFLSLTWGSSFILIKKSMFPVSESDMVFNPFHVGTLRVVIAGTFLLPVAYKFRKFLTKKDARKLLIVSTFGNLIPAVLFPLAETNVDSSLAGLLNMSASFFAVIIGAMFYKAKPNSYQLIGLALGSTGLYLILSGQMNAAETKDMRYAFFIFPATLGYAISLTTIKFKLQHVPSSAITSLSFFLILGPAIVMSFVLGSFNPIVEHQDGLTALGYLSILSVVGTAIALLLFTRLIAISNHIFSSAVAYMLPVVAILMGLLDGEKFHWINYLWVAIILGGVILMSKNTKAQ